MFQMNTAQVVDGLAQNQEAMLARSARAQAE
jgi:hypothetical protein